MDSPNIDNTFNLAFQGKEGLEDRLTDWYEKQQKEVKKNTLDMYINNTFKLYRDVFGQDPLLMENFDWIKDIPKMEDYFTIHKRSDSTRRNYYTAVLIILLATGYTDQKAFSELEKTRDNYDKRYKEAPAMKSEKQKENMIESKVIDDKVKEMDSQVRLIARKDKNLLFDNDKKILQLWMILRILRTYDFRNEVATFYLTTMRHYKNFKKSQLKMNLVIKDGKEWFISANEYKTSKKYAEKITKVEDKKLIKDLMLYRRMMGDGYMFKSSFKNDTNMTNNELSKLLLKWSQKELPPVILADGTKRLRNISTTLLAKIMLSEKYGEKKAELIKDAKNRGHDPQTAMKVYIATPDELK